MSACVLKNAPKVSDRHTRSQMAAAAATPGPPYEPRWLGGSMCYLVTTHSVLEESMGRAERDVVAASTTSCILYARTLANYLYVGRRSRIHKPSRGPPISSFLLLLRTPTGPRVPGPTVEQSESIAHQGVRS